MSRPLRIQFPGATYPVMNRGLAAQPIFETDADRTTFLEGLGEVHARWGLQIFLARQVAMYVCREVGGYSHRAIAQRLQAGSYSTISTACAMLQKQLADHRTLRKQIEKIRHAWIGRYGQPAT